MPIYEYVCDAGHESERRQSMSAEALEVCPRDGCGSAARRKISGGGGFLVGGDGSSGGSGEGACGPSCCRTGAPTGFT